MEGDAGSTPGLTHRKEVDSGVELEYVCAALHHSTWLVLRACDRRVLFVPARRSFTTAPVKSVEDPFTVIDFGVADVRCLRAATVQAKLGTSKPLGGTVTRASLLR